MKNVLFLLLILLSVSIHAQDFGPWNDVPDVNNYMSACIESHPTTIFKSGFVTHYKLRNNMPDTYYFKITFTYEEGGQQTFDWNLGNRSEHTWTLDTRLIKSCKIAVYKAKDWQSGKIYNKWDEYIKYMEHVLPPRPATLGVRG